MKTLKNLRNKFTSNWGMRSVLFFGAFLVLLLIASCGKDDPVAADSIAEDPTTEDPSSELTFAQVVANGEEFDDFPESRTTTDVGESSTANRDDVGVSSTERFRCTTKTVSVLDGNGQFPLFNTSADVIYPGNLLQGKTLSDATPKPIVVGRAGGTISYNLNNANLNSFFTVDEVKKSTIQNGMNFIIASAGEVVPADFQVDIIQIESVSQMALEMGIEVETFTTKVEGNLSFSTEKEYNRTLVKVNQSYYTMSFDLPTSLDEIFGENVTPAQLETYVQADNPATFISSVTYGRIFYMLIESTSSREEMQASLKVTYDAAAINGTGTLDVVTFDSLKEVKIKAIAYGGDAEGSFQLLGETSIAAIADKIGASTDIRAGLPLSYVVRSVERPDQVVGTKLATEYDIVTCIPKGILAPDNYQELVDIFGPGPGNGIGAATKLTGAKFLVYNKAGDKYAFYDLGTGKKGVKIYNVDEGPFRMDTAFGPVGAALLYRANQLHFFNEDGTKFVKYNSVTSSFGSDLNQCDFLDCDLWQTGTNPDYRETSIYYAAPYRTYNDFPFVGDGIDAAVANESDALFEYEFNLQTYFSNYGSTSAVFVSFKEQTTLGNWKATETTKDLLGTPFFDRVGAAVKISYSTNSVNYLYFNEAGDQMIIKGNQTFKGPYVIN
jgi:thiol-activated cytolysin